MRLVFVDLTHSSCEYENGEEVKGYHLVYEPDPSHASSFRMVLENEVEETNYVLLYKQTTDENYKESFDCSREICYIDAHTGEKLWSK